MVKAKKKDTTIIVVPCITPKNQMKTNLYLELDFSKSKAKIITCRFFFLQILRKFCVMVFLYSKNTGKPVEIAGFRFPYFGSTKVFFVIFRKQT